MEMPVLTDEHRKLEKLAGDWKGEDVYPTSQFHPNGATGQTKIRAHTSLGGFALIQDFQETMDGKVSFEGHGVFRWDSNENCYHLHWFDSMGFPPTDARGSFNGDAFVLEEVGNHGHIRLTYEVADPNTIRFRMEMAPQPGQPMQSMMEGTYRRA